MAYARTSLKCMTHKLLKVIYYLRLDNLSPQTGSEWIYCLHSSLHPSIHLCFVFFFFFTFCLNRPRSPELGPGLRQAPAAAMAGAAAGLGGCGRRRRRWRRRKKKRRRWTPKRTGAPELRSRGSRSPAAPSSGLHLPTGPGPPRRTASPGPAARPFRWLSPRLRPGAFRRLRPASCKSQSPPPLAFPRIPRSAPHNILEPQHPSPDS